MFDYLIVGAGLAGGVLAEKLAAANKKVLIVEKRNHIGGNTFDFYNDDGILVHKYGPHIFHTNSKEVFTYLSQFTEWRPYEHRVLASVDGMQVRRSSPDAPAGTPVHHHRNIRPARWSRLAAQAHWRRPLLYPRSSVRSHDRRT